MWSKKAAGKVIYRGIVLAPRFGKRSALAKALRHGLESLGETSWRP